MMYHVTSVQRNAIADVLWQEALGEEPDVLSLSPH